MSYDLKIKSGDIVIDQSGDLQKVEHTDKLVQDCLKILVTPVGGNPFFTWYGSLISKLLVGTAEDETFIRTISDDQIRRALTNLQELQRKQQDSNQKISAAELLAAIQTVSVKRNKLDPTMYTVFARVLSKDLKSVGVRFDVL